MPVDDKEMYEIIMGMLVEHNDSSFPNQAYPVKEIGYTARRIIDLMTRHGYRKDEL